MRRRRIGVSGMAENKTKETTASVTSFLNAIDDQRMRIDARKIAAMMRRATGTRARMWGSSIVGYGKYHYKYASGREGDSANTKQANPACTSEN